MRKYIRGRVARNRAQAARYILALCGLFLVVILLQTTLFSHLRVFGTVSDLCYGTLLLVAYFCGRETGAVAGIASGFAVEALGSVGVSLLPVVYLLCGYVCGHFTRAIVPRRFSAFAAVLGVGLPVRGAVTLIQVCLTYSSISLPRILVQVILPELLGTGLLALALYWPVRQLCRWIDPAAGAPGTA